ncbi:unnamed protein product, partial [Closterium sp. NIES-53]
LADFGLALFLEEGGEQGEVQEVQGTLGYMAPEYFMFGDMGPTSDAYSLGIVLLEIITGRRAIEMDPPPDEDNNLVVWALPKLTSMQVEAIVDPCLRGRYDRASLWRTAAAAIMCLREDPAFRPPLDLLARFIRDDSFNNPQVPAFTSFQFLSLTHSLTLQVPQKVTFVDPAFRPPLDLLARFIRDDSFDNPQVPSLHTPSHSFVLILSMFDAPQNKSSHRPLDLLARFIRDDPQVPSLHRSLSRSPYSHALHLR